MSDCLQLGELPMDVVRLLRTLEWADPALLALLEQGPGIGEEPSGGR